MHNIIKTLPLATAKNGTNGPVEATSRIVDTSSLSENELCQVETRSLEQNMAERMNELLTDAASELCQFLKDRLPAIGGESWWTKSVVYQLSHSQQRRVEQAGISNLEDLDLAALIRILDRNWYELSWREKFPPDARHFVKEMGSVRNRWAHASVRAYDEEDTYRDLDTLQRFLASISASEDLLIRVTRARRELIGAPPEEEDSFYEDEAESTAEPVLQVSFQPTQLVRLKSDSSKTGPVLAVQAQEAENRYQVFLDGAPKWFYESQLEAAEPIRKTTYLSFYQFHAYLTALQILNPSLSTLYSLNAARVDFIPYQFRPVLKFIRADRPRLLIADSTGVGKTIEAGLILRELQARRDIRSVLVICPKPLVTERKWLSEMKRFEERFTQLDGNTLRFCISETDLEGEWPQEHAKTIIPYSLFDENQLHGTMAAGSSRRKNGQRGLLDLNPPPRFDLVIVDEAHHVRNPNTYSHEAVRFFCDNAEAVVFLTATPLMLGSEDLFVLLNLLRPDLIIDEESFHHMAAPNPYINRAIDAVREGSEGWESKAKEALASAAQTDWGNRILSADPEFHSLVSDLDNREMLPAERVGAIQRLENLHTFSNIINRTRRRDIGEFTVREPRTVEVEFTPSQRELHDELLAVQAEILSTLRPSTSINFMMTTIRRQAASCLFGLAPLLDDILNRRIGELASDESVDEYSLIDSEVVQEIRDQVAHISHRARQLEGTEDPKLSALLGVIEQKQEFANNKAMVFSSFRHTLHYLYTNLAKSGIRVGMVHGGVKDSDRVLLREQFQAEKEKEEALDVLLFSEVGCEGLDYQFCDCLVNYDLPWNPMRIEQRIGRIDRKGQKSEKVLIYNLITPGTVDAAIYERCLMRIGVFTSALGAGEEILGDIAKEIRTVAEDIQLSHEERAQKLQQVADNKIRLIQEQRVLEDKEVELFGIKVPRNQAQEDIEEASSYWLSPQGIQNLVEHYLQGIAGKSTDYFAHEKTTKTLRFPQSGRQELLRDYQLLPRVASPIHRQWENWLKGGESRLPITFNTQDAIDHQSAAFLTPIHPLARQAASRFAEGIENPRCVIGVIDDELPPGNYPFVIYQWRFTGVGENLTLFPVAESEQVTAKLEQFLEHGSPAKLMADKQPDPSVYEQLDSQHYQLWNEARTKHVERNQRLVEYRLESLKTSHRARLAMLEERVNQATEDRIRRMKLAQVITAESDFERKCKELEEAKKSADLQAEPIAHGVIVLRRAPAQ